jgi:CHAT domain-containing protein/tetratricopeptide (TPR) repeat protein
VEATFKITNLQIAQQPVTNSQDAIRAAAQKALEKGLAFYKEGSAESLRQAIKNFEIALQLWQKVGNKAKQALSLVGIGTVYSALGEKHKALEYYNRALPLLRAVGDRGGEAATLNNIGVLYDNLGEKHKALEYHNRALPLRRAVGDRGGEAQTLNNIGAVYSTLGEKHKALEYHNRALPLRRAVGDRGGEAATLTNIGKVYDDLGEKHKALEHYNQALPMHHAVGNRRGEATTLNNIGVLYDNLGEKNKALEYHNQALPLRRAVGDRDGEAQTLNNIGGVYEDLGKKDKALEYYNQAFALYRAVGNRRGEAATLSNIAGVYSALGEKYKALEHYNQALPLRHAVGDRGGEAKTLNNIGRVYFDIGEKHKALEYYNQALPLLRAVGDRGGKATTLGNIASLERNQGKLEESLKRIEAAIEIIEDLRRKVVNQDLRTSYFASVQSYYKFYIDLLMQLHKKNPSKGYDAEALHASERSRARGLLELLTEAGADIRKGVDPQLLTEEKRLQQLINARAKLLQDLPDKPETERAKAKLTKEVEDLLTQQKELQTKIRTTSRKYAQIPYPEPLKLPQIQQQLDKDTLLLQYSLGKERSYLWAVTPNSLNTYELPGREAIEKSAGTFKELLKKCQKPGLDCQKLPTEQKAKDFQEITQAATELSKLILAPVAQKLGKKRLVIVADGALQEIPFAALSEFGQIPPTSLEKSPQASKSNYQPLLVNHEIVNLPSVTAIAIHREDLSKRQPAPKTLAVLADPVFTLDDQRFTGKPPSLAPELKRGQSSLQRAARNLKRTQWARLLGTRKEAEQILKLVPPSESLHAFDFDANYNFATSQKLKQYRFILFATHGFADPINPELSGIVLSQIDKQGKPNIPGMLHLGDIFNLDLGADLVVLSACETGVGKDVQGEGLMGLTRGLMYAGAKRAVVSLWQIDDTGTSELMPQFYTAILQQKASPTTALREAQLKLWQQKNWRNPYYWAAFTLQGEWR